jgi:SAM-dependent methyltransferase
MRGGTAHVAQCGDLPKRPLIDAQPGEVALPALPRPIVPDLLRGDRPAARKVMDDTVVSPFLEFCDLQVGQRVLDVGSGPGWHIRAASRIVPPTGRAVGVDLSETMLAEARQLAAEPGVDVDFVQGSAYALPFEQNSFDCCLSVDTMHCLDDPAHALREMVRVTRSGSHICLLEYHCDGIFIGPAGNPLTRRLLDFVHDHECAQSSGFEVVSTLKSLGATNVQVRGVLDHGDNHTFNFAWARAFCLEEWLADAVTAGVLTAEEARQWLADQETHASTGRFVLGLPLFLIKATKQ